MIIEKIYNMNIEDLGILISWNSAYLEDGIDLEQTLKNIKDFILGNKNIEEFD